MPNQAPTARIRPVAIRLALAACVPLAMSAQCPDGSPPPCGAANARAAAPRNAIAVLYFDNLSRDSADAYLADGLTEELISRLAQVQALRVKSRTVVRRLRSADLNDPAAIGRKLGVAHLVSGSVLPTRGRLRVNIELTSAASGNTLWARSFDRSANDLLDVEAEIAESLAVNVAGRLGAKERERIEQAPTRNAAAYDHFLRGRYEASRRTTASLLRALHEFETASRLDPRLISAFVGIAATYGQLGTLYYAPSIGLPRDSLFARSDAAVAAAVRIDSTSPEALLARAARFQDPRVSRGDLQRAVARDPRNPDAWHALGLALRLFGDDSATIDAFRRASDLDPDRAISLVNIGQTLIFGRRYRDASRWIDSAVATSPEAAFYYFEQGAARLLLGDTSGARASAELAASHGRPASRDEILAMLSARAGDTVAARERMRDVRAHAPSDCELNHECLDLSYTLASIGERDAALDALERITPRNYWLAQWLRRPEFDPIRNEPRFQRVAEESNRALGTRP